MTVLRLFAVDVARLSLRVFVRSSPVVAVVSFFSGAMLTVQVASSVASFGAQSMAGMVVGFGGVREVFPLLAAGSLAARSGAEIAGTIGTFKHTDQLSALRVMGLQPAWLVGVPRVLACVLAGPLCVWLSVLSGLLGAHVVGVLQLGIDRGDMWSRLVSTVGAIDVVVGGVRGLLLGLVCGVVAVREGFGAGAGALGVGRAATQAVVRGMVIVCLVSLAFSMLVYGPSR
jgi:phospholipid/cholesterol/gamma-HCH transport system permease protein